MPRLNDLASRTARATDRRVLAFMEALRRVLRDTEREIRPLVTDALAGDRTALVKAARAATLRTAVREAMTRAGYDDLIEQALDAAFDDLTSAALARSALAKASSRLLSGQQARLLAVQALHIGDLLAVAQDVADALSAAVLRASFSAASPETVMGDLAAHLDDAAPRVRTLYDTAVSIYHRQVEAVTATDGPDVPFVYLGPVDDVIRPFCEDLVGKVLTRQAIEALDNGQLDNVFLTGGGYNCRHVWQEVSRLSDLAALVGTDERAPEVAADLERLQEA